jgi:hypothetical protein
MATRIDKGDDDGDISVSTEVPHKAKKSLIDVAAIRGDTPAMREQEEIYRIEQTDFPVKKPGNKAWFRAHPDPEFHLPNVRLLEDPEDKAKFILPKGYTPPSDVQEFVEYVTLVTCVDLRGTVFLWPIKNTANNWGLSARRVVKAAIDRWVRIRPNMRANSYDIYKAPPELSNIAPKWPTDTTFEDILITAFEDHEIGDDNHLLIRRLQGKEI